MVATSRMNRKRRSNGCRSAPRSAVAPATTARSHEFVVWTGSRVAAAPTSISLESPAKWVRRMPAVSAVVLSTGPWSILTSRPRALSVPCVSGRRNGIAVHRRLTEAVFLGLKPRRAEAGRIHWPGA